MTTTLTPYINDIIRREGGYVDHSADKGGPTKYGITLANYRAWVGRPGAPASELKSLSQDEAIRFYNWYFKSRKIDDLPPDLLPLALDLCTLHSPGGVNKILDRVANALQPDPPLPRGEFFARMVEEFGPRITESLITLSRIAYFREICNANPSQNVFLLGWLNRCKEFEVWNED